MCALSYMVTHKTEMTKAGGLQPWPRSFNEHTQAISNNYSQYVHPNEDKRTPDFRMVSTFLSFQNTWKYYLVDV